MTTMICPKCMGAMRTYERNGVTVEQCTDCRGLFLDRGELEHLLEAETRFANPATPATGAPQPAQRFEQPRQEPRYDRPAEPRFNPQQSAYPAGYQSGYGKKRRKSFLEELFD